MELSDTDYKAINMIDGDYLRVKAQLLENNGDDNKAIEYYRLAALLEDNESIGHIGEYYLNNNISLALAYFNIGVEKEDILSLYNLGTLYFEGKKVDKDLELGHYYYSKALEIIELKDTEEQLKYPYLYFSVAQDIINQANSIEPLFQAYHYLVIAADGFEDGINNGNDKYSHLLKKVVSIMNSKQFDEVREILEHNESNCECGDECSCDHH